MAVEHWGKGNNIAENESTTDEEEGLTFGNDNINDKN